VGKSWNISASLSKSAKLAFFRTAYSYGESKNTVDPGSIALGSWTGNAVPGDPNNPPLAFAASSPGHRFFLTGGYRLEYFKFGATSFSAFYEARTNGNTSYTYAFDLNGDGGTSNDLLYVPRNTSEMYFVPFTSGGITFTAEQQAAAWDAYINQDKYLSKRRGQYAERNAIFLPLLHRLDFSVAQDVFFNLAGTTQRFQVRLDCLNFGNLLNSDWGVGQRLVTNQPLTNLIVDSSGRPTYRLRVVNNQLISKTYEPTANFSSSGISDVYQFMVSIKYFFN
jgi:hypothetical protein